MRFKIVLSTNWTLGCKHRKVIKGADDQCLALFVHHSYPQGSEARTSPEQKYYHALKSDTVYLQINNGIADVIKPSSRIQNQ